MDANVNQPRRATALDALRGYAIATMVLCGNIAFGILPAWMYHAQTPPPTHEFRPDIPGLTWVDLVFPFFLFAMGAAFPFSIRKRLERGDSKGKLCLTALLRGLQMAFFAIFIQHFYPWTLSSPQDTRAWLLTLCAFQLLFPMFMRMPFKLPKWGHTAIKAGAFAVAALMLAFTDYAGDASFSPGRSNIIIMVLANMAFFATSVYILTMESRTARIVIMAIVGGIMLGKDIDGSWTKAVYDWSPVPWLYRFNYLKYLFVTLTGSMAGEMLLGWMNSVRDEAGEAGKPAAVGICLISLAVIVMNLVGLQSRHVTLTVIVTAILLACGWLIVRNRPGSGRLWKSLWTLGSALIITGLAFEPFQGGIKKDHATFSYLILTPGLACMALVFFHVICDYFRCRRSVSPLVMSGQNPMLAYVASAMLINPVLNLTGLMQYMNVLNTNPWLGVLRGFIITGFALAVTMFFSKIKWFWRT